MGAEYRDGEEDDPLPFDAATIDHLLLTHAHADHMGQMLKLFKAGYTGNVFSTYQTADIAKLQLDQVVNGPFMHNKWAKGKKFRFGPNKGEYIPFKDIKYVSKDVGKAMPLIFLILFWGILKGMFSQSQSQLAGK